VTFQLEIETSEGGEYPPECDGCGRVVPQGERLIFGIESCCGGGCARRLCADCVRKAFDLLGLADTACGEP
jgi:hypothetical protein